MMVCRERTDLSTSATTGSQRSSSAGLLDSSSLPTTVGYSDGGGDKDAAVVTGVEGGVAARFCDNTIEQAM